MTLVVIPLCPNWGMFVTVQTWKITHEREGYDGDFHYQGQVVR